MFGFIKDIKEFVFDLVKLFVLIPLVGLYNLIKEIILDNSHSSNNIVVDFFFKVFSIIMVFVFIYIAFSTFGETSGTHVGPSGTQW